MSCCELEIACLIPAKKVKKDVEETVDEPYIRFKGTEYRKTVTFRVPSWQPIKSKLKRFFNWLSFVWCHSRARKCRKLTFATILSIFLISFTITFVLIPLAFKYSTSFQKHIAFHPTINSHESYSTAIEFRRYDRTTYYKPKNMFVVVDKSFNISLGLWSLAPGKQDNNLKTTGESPYLLYFHDFVGDRRKYTKVYEQLMKNFHIITFDYRSYGDSSEGDLSETDLVKDSVQLYKWLLHNTNSSIFIWGDCLGAAVAAHTVLKLQNENIKTIGLILERPFLSMSDYLKHKWFIAKMLTYTFWFRQTITDPLLESDLSFAIEDNILKIDCPIMFICYGRYDSTFDNYVNSEPMSYQDFNITQKHVRVRSQISYFFDYEFDTSNFLSSITHFIRASTHYAAR